MRSLPKRQFAAALLWLVANLPVTNRAPGQEPPTLADLKKSGAANSSYRQPARRHPAAIAPQADVDTFKRSVGPILRAACADCHGADLQEGNIRVDTLDPDLLHGDDIAWWLEVFAVLSKGEMPPADASELSDVDRATVVDWLSQELQAASLARRAEGKRSSFRRMTRYEYNYALQDLLGLPYDFARDLPPESTSEDGFLNSAEMLHMSASQLGMYRESALKALQRATVEGNRPTPLYWQISMQEAAGEAWESYEREQAALREKLKSEPDQLAKELEQLAQQRRAPPRGLHYKNRDSGWSAPVQWNYRQAKYAWKPAAVRNPVPDVSPHVVVIPPRQRLIVELGERVPDEGLLRVRVRASRVGEGLHPPSLQLEFGWQASNDSAAAVRISRRDLVVDSNEPKFYQWEAPLDEIYPRNNFRKTEKLGGLPNPSELIKIVNSSSAQGSVQIDYVEVSAPQYRHWPTKSHLRIFPPAVASLAEKDEQRAARRTLQPFMTKAWRRPIATDEVEQKLAMFQAVRPECDTFQEAMLEVLATVIASPKFLYLSVASDGDGPQSLSQHELATRLAMFLWCSVPDDELRSLADRGDLDSATLETQVQRMLADPKARRFCHEFVRQWLGMQLLDYLQVDRKVYRQFDPTLKEAMQEEPIAFFYEVLQRNHSVLDFVHADYAMVNERLARHYGIQGVFGNQFRRVPLAPELPRGGLLTQAGLLAMNSDGRDSHPLKRGIWLLESLLDDPPPPPPPAVPKIDLADPEIAKLTLKERMEDHRNQAACRSCHMKIDPWGIAFENFDAIGSWRTEVQGKPVDAASLLFNQQELNGMDGLKRFLLKNRQDQFVRAMVHKLATYAVGRPLSFGDRSSIDQIASDVRRKDDGLATMVLTIVRSPLFLTK